MLADRLRQADAPSCVGKQSPDSLSSAVDSVRSSAGCHSTRRSAALATTAGPSRGGLLRRSRHRLVVSEVPLIPFVFVPVDIASVLFSEMSTSHSGWGIRLMTKSPSIRACKYEFSHKRRRPCIFSCGVCGNTRLCSSPAHSVSPWLAPGSETRRGTADPAQRRTLHGGHRRTRTAGRSRTDAVLINALHSLIQGPASSLLIRASRQGHRGRTNNCRAGGLVAMNAFLASEHATAGSSASPGGALQPEQQAIVEVRRSGRRHLHPGINQPVSSAR